MAEFLVPREVAPKFEGVPLSALEPPDLIYIFARAKGWNRRVADAVIREMIRRRARSMKQYRRSRGARA